MTTTTHRKQFVRRSIAAAVVLLAGTGVALSSVPANAATAAHRPTVPSTVVVCGGRTAERPPTLVGSCLTGDLVWRNLRWTGWNSKRPTATAIQTQNVIDSAKGSWTTTRVRLVLTDPVTAHGVRRFQQVAVERIASHEVIDRYRLDSHGATFLN